MSDEVRTRLGKVAGLEVIARGSSLEYRRTTKRPSEIAHELGADYLLTGTVRWEKKSGGASRVRVTPELVDARPGQAARSRWGEQFDASLTDVFQVQGDIATKVADALGVALADSTQRELTAKPTENLAAYDEFLKGEAASQAMSVTDPPVVRRAIGFYERAVALDSTFATAWARLSHARSRLYGNGVPDPALGEQARLAAERARRLKPNEPLVYRAFGAYYSIVNPIDVGRAQAEYEQGAPTRPRQCRTARGAWGDRVEFRPLGQCGRADFARGPAGPPLGRHRQPPVGCADQASAVRRGRLRSPTGRSRSPQPVWTRCGRRWWLPWPRATSTAPGR